jgi:hypothetical protein
MIIGDNILGIIVTNLKDLETSIICINFYPFKIVLEHLRDEKCYQFSLNIFKIKIGIFFQY